MKKTIFLTLLLNFYVTNLYSQGFERSIDQLLYDASFEGNLASIKSLLTKGANPNAKSSVGGGTILKGAAAGTKNIEVLETLVKAGAKANEKDENGTTALSSIGDGGLPYFKFFIEHGCDVNEQGIRANGKYKGIKMMSPLHFAASTGDKELVLYLLSKGAKTDSTFGPKNLSAEDLAKKKNHVDIVKIIQNATKKEVAAEPPVSKLQLKPEEKMVVLENPVLASFRELGKTSYLKQFCGDKSWKQDYSKEIGIQDQIPKEQLRNSFKKGWEEGEILAKENRPKC